MKSIKEKSEELSTAFRKEQGDVGYSEQLSYKFGVEAGANYVLDEIENVIKSDRILGHPFPSLEMRYNQIINIIEQLKGNQ